MCYLHLLIRVRQTCWENGEKKYFLNKDGESLDLYLKGTFKKTMFIKSLVFRKKNEQRNEIKF